MTGQCQARQRSKKAVTDNSKLRPEKAVQLALNDVSEVTQIELGPLMPLTAPNSSVFPLSPLSPIIPLPLVRAEEIGTTVCEGIRAV